MQERRIPTVIVADELALFRDGVAALCELSGRVKVLGTAVNGEEAWRQMEVLLHDVALLDFQLDRLHCLEIARRLPESSRTRCTILGFRTDRKTVIEVLRSGSQGYFLKSGSGAQLLECIELVAAGGVYVSPSVDMQSIFTPGRTGMVQDPLSLLSAREYQVFSLLVEGVRAKEIAHRLGLSPKTVDTYRSNLMKKLAIHDVPGLVRFALHHRLIQA